MNKRTKNLILFFVATFIWTWAFYTPIAAGHHNPYEMPWLICLIFGGMGPSLVGVVLVILTYDQEHRRDYWHRCFSFRRIRLMWWAVILMIFPVLYGLSIVVDIAMGG